MDVLAGSKGPACRRTLLLELLRHRSDTCGLSAGTCPGGTVLGFELRRLLQLGLQGVDAVGGSLLRSVGGVLDVGQLALDGAFCGLHF